MMRIAYSEIVQINMSISLCIHLSSERDKEKERGSQQVREQASMGGMKKGGQMIDKKH